MTFTAWAIFVLLIGYTIWDGVRRTIGSKTMEGFFAAGRNIPWWAAGLSVMATQLSAITLIGGVGMGYENGLEWVQFYFALPFAMIVLCIWFLPMYRQHPILTAYEYLERRFGPVTRTLTSASFLVSRCLAFAVVLYAPGVVFSAMSGVPIVPMVLITGVVTTAYTVAGGVGGVVWTDVKQMVIIVVGIGVCLTVLLWQTAGELGLSGVFATLGAAGKVNAFEVANDAWTLAPTGATSFWSDKYNVWTGLFGTLFLFLSYFGCDQSQVQSILTARSVNASRRALLLSAFTKVPLQLLVLFLGGLLWLHHALGSEPLLFDPQQQAAATRLEGEAKQAFAAAESAHATARDARGTALRQVAAGDAAATGRYQAAVVEARRARDAARAAMKGGDDINYILPDYLFRETPKVVLGLMIAAIFAAAISSAAGALSSLTSAFMIDFYRRWFARGGGEQRTLLVSRFVMTGFGLAATVAATTIGDRPLLEQVNIFGSSFYGAILGVFLLGLFVPRAGGRAAAVGLVTGLAVVQAVDWTLNVAYLWYNLIGCAACMLAGGAVAIWAPRR